MKEIMHELSHQKISHHNKHTPNKNTMFPQFLKTISVQKQAQRNTETQNSISNISSRTVPKQTQHTTLINPQNKMRDSIHHHKPNNKINQRHI